MVIYQNNLIFLTNTLHMIFGLLRKNYGTMEKTIVLLYRKPLYETENFQSLLYYVEKNYNTIVTYS